jgi:HEAT repeat protein
MEPASVALREVGASAVPFLFAKLRREDPTYGSWQRYHDFWGKLPTPLHSVLPKPKSGNLDQARVCNALLAIGPPALPGTLDGLQNPNPAVRCASAWALGSWPKAREDLTTVLPALVARLQDANPEARQRAAWAIGQFGPQGAPAVPQLISMLSDPDQGTKPGSTVFVRAWAACALGRIGSAAQPAVPPLQTLSKDPDYYAQLQATIALWRITQRTNDTLPVLVQLLGSVPQDSKWEVIDALGEMGPQAASTGSLLEAEVSRSPAWLQSHLTNALGKIRPDQTSPGR